MFEVKDFMTRDVICVERDTKISEVLDLMRFHHIHRIPVVNKDNELVGLITEGMIAGQGNSATSLSIYELNYLLSKTEVKTVMVRKVHSIYQDDLMEQAAAKLLKYDVGCLPVVDENNKVTGILTQNDVFKAFLDVLGWEKGGTRLTVEAPDVVGGLEKIASIFADNNINLYNIGVYDSTNGIASMVIQCDSKDPAKVIAGLNEAGFKVLKSMVKE